MTNRSLCVMLSFRSPSCFKRLKPLYVQGHGVIDAPLIAYMLQCIALPVLPRGWPILPMACSAHEEGVSS